MSHKGIPLTAEQAKVVSDAIQKTSIERVAADAKVSASTLRRLLKGHTSYPAVVTVVCDAARNVNASPASG